VLQSWRPNEWLDMYAFGLEEQYPIDFEVANHYTATYPGGVFTKMLLAQRPGPELRTVVMNRKLIERTADGVTEKVLGDDEDLRDVLARRFGLVFPPGTRFPIEEG